MRIKSTEVECVHGIIKEDLYITISNYREIEKLLYIKFYKEKNEVTVDLEIKADRDILRKIMLMPYITKVVYINSFNEKEEVKNTGTLVAKFSKKSDIPGLISDEAIMKFQQIQKRDGDMVEVSNFAILTFEVIEILERNNITKAKMIGDRYIYQLETLKSIKEQVEEYRKNATISSETEKFMDIYTLLCANIELDENEEKLGYLEGIITGKSSQIGFAIILNYMLSEFNIKSNIVRGTILNSVPHTWNQVKVDGMWYNTDLALDAITYKEHSIRYMNQYCLKRDETFYKDHTPNPNSKLENCDRDSIYVVAEQIEAQKNFVSSIKNKVGRCKRIRNKSQLLGNK